MTILFIGLKLTHSIDWSWVWVLCPAWATLALAAALFLVGVLFGLIGKLRGSN